MADYISRNEAINAIKSLESSMPAKDNYAKGYDAALGRVLIAVRGVPPTADVQPVKQGKWIYVGSVRSWDEIKCSACDTAFSTEDRDLILNWNFCPNCGARMGGEQNDD